MSEDDVAENEVKYYVFVRNGCRHYDPQHLSAGMMSVIFIFPMPESNTIGTLDEYSNGIVLINFKGYGEEPECKVIAQKFNELVLGPPFKYRFCPNFSEEVVVYSKAQGAVVTNIKTGEVFHVGCGLLRDDDYMLGIRFLDPQKDLFVKIGRAHV